MLVGKNVFLRPVEEADLPLLVAWRNAPEIWSGFFNKFPLSMAGQKGWLATLLADERRRLFVVCRQVDSVQIGTLGFENIDFPNQSAELGNVLIGREDCRGKGYAAEAAELMLAYGFLRLNFNRLYVHLYADNVDAAGLYERCGFKKEGELREARFESGGFKHVLVMGLLRKEWAAGHGK